MNTLSTSQAVFLPFAPRKGTLFHSRQQFLESSLPSTTRLAHFPCSDPKRDSMTSVSRAEPIVLSLPPRTRTRTFTPSMFSESSCASSSSSSSASSSASYPFSSHSTSSSSSSSPSPSPRSSLNRKLRPLPMPPLSPSSSPSESPLSPNRPASPQPYENPLYIQPTPTSTPTKAEFPAPAPPATPAPPYSPRQNIYRLPSPPPIPTFPRLTIGVTARDDSAILHDTTSNPPRVDIMTPIIESPVPTSPERLLPSGSPHPARGLRISPVSATSTISISSFPLPPPPPFADDYRDLESEPSSPSSNSSDLTPTPTGVPRVRPLPMLPVAPGPPSECSTPVAMFPRGVPFELEVHGATIKQVLSSERGKLGRGGEDEWADDSETRAASVRDETDGEIDWDLIGAVMETAA